MRELIDLQLKLFPDLVHVMQRRYQLLHFIQLMEPIGRRALAESSNLAERTVRSEVDFLQEIGLIDITSKGMNVTREGKQLIQQFGEIMKEMSGIRVLEKKISETLNIGHVIIVSGDSDHQPWAKQEMGRACVNYLKSILKESRTIAVTGGSSMAAVAEMMNPTEVPEGCLFVPARGGLGEQVENQANTICAEMAKKARGKYRLLYVPDPISEESYQSMIEEPSIKEVLEVIRKPDVVIHGIGEAITMATRRRTNEQDMKKIHERQAVGESFGYYFDKQGEIVHRARTVGLQWDDLPKVNHVIALAGGKSKAAAILSYFKKGFSDVLITDEGSAIEILEQI
ncbi:sugar-binding domain-containing protein [Bacillaceae bacterium S4-13-56]